MRQRFVYYRCAANPKCVLARKHEGECQLEKQPGDRARAAAGAHAARDWLLEANRPCGGCGHSRAMHVDGDFNCTECTCTVFE